MVYTIKSCGKAHPACAKCKPEVYVRGARFSEKSCGKRHPFCAECRPELIAARVGRKNTEETRRRMSEAALRSWQDEGIAQSRREAWRVSRTRRTSLERALALLLDEAGIAFKEQVQFGRCTVDAWAPDLGWVFEADGIFWHRDTERTIRRDAYLIDRGVQGVVHWDEHDLAPWIA